MNVSENIARVGMEIDPTPAESGAKRGKAAAKEAEQALNDLAKTSDSANNRIAKSTEQSGGAFMRLVRTAQQMAKGVAGAFSGVVSGAIGMAKGVVDQLGKIGLAIDGVKKLAAVGGLVTTMLGPASDMEGFRNQWAFMLGSFDKARTKMAELQTFANKTPFDLPGVTQAALTLAKMEDQSLKGAKGLKILGDAAAIANQPIDEVATKVQRLIGNLARGGGAGTEALILSDWQILSPTAVARLSEFGQDASKAKENIALVVSELMRAKNGMDLMAGTWKGLTSTLDDSFNTLKTAIGEPLMEGLKPMIVFATQGIDKITEQVKGWAPEIRNFGIQISAAFKVLTDPGGIQLGLSAAGEVFTAIIKRGFEIASRLLANAFDVIGHKFLELMTHIASFEFWVGVGRALVAGAQAGLAALKGAFSDEFAAGLGFDPASFKQQREVTEQLQRMNSRQQIAMARQADPATSYSGAGGAKLAELDVDALINFQKDLDKLNKAMPKWEPAPGPELMSPGQINDALGPIPQGESTQEFMRRQVQAAMEAEKVSSGLLGAQTDVLAGRGGPAESLLFPGGTGEGGGVDLKEAAKAQKDLASDAERWAKAVETPYETYQRTVEELEKMHALGKDAGGLTDEQYVRALTKAQNEYAEATKKASEEQVKAHEKELTEHQKLIQSWANLKKQVDTVTVGAANSITSNLSQALTDLVSGTKDAKTAFADMSKAIVNDILKMITNMLVQIAYAKILGWVTGTPTAGIGSMIGTIGGGGNVLAGFKHDGGDVGSASRHASLPAGLFMGAQRFHGGGTIGSDEVPIIAQKGETMLTRSDAAKIRNRMDGKEESSGAGGITIINVLDPNLVADHFAKNPKAILNYLSPEMPMIKRMVGASSL